VPAPAEHEIFGGGASRDDNATQGFEEVRGLLALADGEEAALRLACVVFGEDLSVFEGGFWNAVAGPDVDVGMLCAFGVAVDVRAEVH